MATGTILTGFLYGTTPGLSSNSPGTHILPKNARGGYLSATGLAGGFTDVQPISTRQDAKSGSVAASFVNDWYNRIHVSPKVLDLGAVSAGMSRSAVLWNAYLNTVTLTGVAESNDDGLNLTGITTPRTYRALEYTVLGISPNESGPATIDTVFTFAFSGGVPAETLSVVGRRARLWPFTPNWSSSVDVTVEYKTDIFVSRSGREQRRSLRKSPRRRIAFSCLIDQSEMRDFHQSMTKWQSRPWVFPDPTRRVLCATAAASGSVEIALESLPGWLVPGKPVIIGSTLTAVAFVNTALNTVTLDTGLSSAVLAGTPLRPAVSGRLSGPVRAQHRSSAATEFSVTFEVEPTSEAEDQGFPGSSIHDGREVFQWKPNWAESVDDEHVWEPEQVDFGFGKVATYTPLAFGAAVRRSNFVHQTADQVEDLLRFFSRYRGQAGEFLMPTWLSDIQPKFDILGSTNFIRVDGTEFVENYSGDATYKAVAVIKTDGTQVYRTVASIASVSDISGTDSIIYFAENWGESIALDQIVMVCWMPVVRFASDAMTVEWLTGEVAQTALAMRTLEYLDAEDPIT